MKMPTATMASERLIMLGRFHIAALEQTEQTRPLAAPFTASVDALEATALATRQASLALIGPRVHVRFAEAALEETLRTLSLRAKTIDNTSAGGPAVHALFPTGLDPIIRPRGEAQ